MTDSLVCSENFVFQTVNYANLFGEQLPVMTDTHQRNFPSYIAVNESSYTNIPAVKVKLAELHNLLCHSYIYILLICLFNDI